MPLIGYPPGACEAEYDEYIVQRDEEWALADELLIELVIAEGVCLLAGAACVLVPFAGPADIIACVALALYCIDLVEDYTDLWNQWEQAQIETDEAYDAYTECMENSRLASCESEPEHADIPEEVEGYDDALEYAEEYEEYA